MARPRKQKFTNCCTPNHTQASSENTSHEVKALHNCKNNVWRHRIHMIMRCYAGVSLLQSMSIFNNSSLNISPSSNSAQGAFLSLEMKSNLSWSVAYNWLYDHHATIWNQKSKTDNASKAPFGRAPPTGGAGAGAGEAMFSGSTGSVEAAGKRAPALWSAPPGACRQRTHLAGLLPEPAVEPLAEPCQRRPACHVR